MALESVVVPALFLADLTVPSQPLKSLGLHLVGEVFGRSNCGPPLGTEIGHNEGRLTFSSRHDVL